MLSWQAPARWGQPEGFGGRTLTITLLFAANMIILAVLGTALALAGWRRRDEPYWASWVYANFVLTAALVVCIFDRHLPPALVGTLPNGLLILGFALRWRAAREFGDRSAASWMIWMPPMVLVAVITPWIGVSYAPAFTAGNILLTALSAATAYEFWRDRTDGLPSRYGLVAAYAVIAASFGVRIVQGFVSGASMPMHMPQDMALTLHLVVAVLHTTASGAFSLSLAYERANARLAHAADHDALTGLLNRGAFETRLRRRLADAGKDAFAVALFDIDHFKQVNDRYGHAAGDEALKRCAGICRAIVGTHGWAARVGGEEFAIVIDGADRLSASVLVEAVRHAVAGATIATGDGPLHLTISAGLCHSSDGPDDFDALMRLVDRALYGAKRKGRNRVERIAA